MPPPAANTPVAAPVAEDLGPLAWVLGEIQKTLENAVKTLRRFAKEAGGSQEPDAVPLRMARQQLHQAVGALQMVSHPAPALVLGAMEFAIQSFAAEPQRCNDAAVQKIERAGFAVTDFLSALLAGKYVSSVGLFPQYRDVLEMVGNERVHPADLWNPNWRWVEIKPAPTQAALVYDPAVRSKLDREVLKVVKTGDEQAARRLQGLCLGLGRGASVPRVASFWTLAAGFFEAIALALVPADGYVKRAASRVLLQYATLARGDTTVSDRLGQDLLFFCAQAIPNSREEAATLRAVRAAWGVTNEQPVDYAVEQFGRFDPQVLATARKRIETAKEMWSALSAGDMARVRQVAESMSQLGESLSKLHPPSAPLVQALDNAVDASLQSGKAPATEMAMEVATSILYLEAAFEDLDPQDRQLTARTVQLAGRIERVREGGPSEALEPWMEELYRRVSDRQTMGTVVGELRSHLGELEKSLDQYFRRPADKTLLRGVPNQLMQMRGVFSVLGLDQAAQTVQHMRQMVDQLIAGRATSSESVDFDALGNNLGALGFLIDMLGYQPVLAKRLFVFDAEAGELKPLMGRQAAEAAEAAAADETTGAPETADAMGAAALASASAPVAAHETVLSVEEVDAQIAAKLAALAAPTRKAPSPIEEFSRAATSWTAKITGPAPLEPLPDTEVTELEEDDLQNIFLDEAREVLHNGLAAVSALGRQADDNGELTVLRRAFHTLKGSARMVGLMDFGDAAWSFEQVLNTWLADQRPATPQLLSVTRSALTDFAKWVEAIASNEPHGWQAAPFRLQADSLRAGEPLAPPRAADADALAAAARHIAAEEEAAALASQPAPLDALPESSAPALPLLPIDLPDLDLIGGDGNAAADAQVPERREPDFDDGFEPTDFLDFDGNPVSRPAALEPVEFSDAEPAITDFEDIDFLETAHTSMEALPPRAGTPAEEVSFESSSHDAPLADGLPTGTAPLDVFPADTLSANATPVDALGLDAPTAASEQAPALEAERETDPLADARALETRVFVAAEAANEAVDGSVAAKTAHGEPVEAFEAADEVDVSASPEAFDAAEALRSHEAPAAADAPEPVVADLRSPTAPSADDQVKVIGPLRIGIALYNVYLIEADEWSRQLASEVGEWALETHRRVPDTAIGHAHALAGSSATVGFQGLSSMARLLESALHHLQRQGHGTPAQGAVLVAAADELRRLLHQFAAGFLKEPAESTLSALRTVAASPMPTEAETPRARHEEADVSLADADEATDVADAVDIDLFPIFEEEAAELLPQLGTALREWAEHPEAGAPRASSLRTLHTLKGSARLAGAMRLGERAHRLESEIEALGTENLDRACVEQLLVRFDALQASFDALRVADDAIQTGMSQRTATMPATDAANEALAEATAPAAPPVATVHAVDAGGVAGAEAIEVPGDTKGAPAGSPAVPEAPASPLAASARVVSDRSGSAGADAPAAPKRAVALPSPSALTPLRATSSQAVRIRTHLLDRLVAQAGEVIITRSRLEVEMSQLRSSLTDLTGNLDRLRQQLRDIEVQAESQMQSRLAQAKDSQQGFDPLEFDRFTRVQELTRMMAESVNDVATVQRTLQKTVQATEDDLSAQARQARELQRGLLRTRMVEFEGISDRLYRVVRQASKDTGKQVRLEIVGGSIEMDRGVLDRMTPAFEHLLRNCVAHGVEAPDEREHAGKEPSGLIGIELHHEGNDVSVTFRDDGAGLNHGRIVERAVALGLAAPGAAVSADEAAQFIFKAGFSTAAQVSELAGRGIGLDVVLAQVAALGGRIETRSRAGEGTQFKLVLPLTTAVTHVVMLRMGATSVGVPSNLVELVQRAGASDLEAAYLNQRYGFAGEQVPFYWGGALLQSSARSERGVAKANTIVVVRSAAQRVALHVDEVLGNQEVVVKNLGPQLSQLPGMAGISVLASGAVALIYNPVALAAVHGDKARALQGRTPGTATAMADGAASRTDQPAAGPTAPAQVPLVLVVDDSITVRRVTQRLLQREGYRVSLAADGLQALERLQQERPAVVLSDIEMPRMDGFDLARNIRADESLADLPIIMITSRIAEKHREHARALGVNHYLGKPYSEDELLRLVRSFTDVDALAALAA